MDFWSRLLAHTRLSSGSSRKDAARDPARRLHRFDREYNQLLQRWRSSPRLYDDPEAAESIEIRLQELTNILTDESRRPLPHPCITFCARKQVYRPVEKVAISSGNEWVIKEAVLFFATLIESEEEAFVENDDFSASLTNLLVRITDTNGIRLDTDTEARVVELAFNVTTKIRLEPNILPAWFKSRGQGAAAAAAAPADEQQKQRDKFSGRTQKRDFPLFYLLMGYIHNEGKIGDFARTGLLYIIEAASNSVALEQWIVESDLSTLMATGLGALYSQLSRKLVIDYPTHELPPVLAFSDYEHPTANSDITSSCSPEFQAHLDTFLSHLLFWQDVLSHCRSVEVKTTLLEHFRVIFLQQLLYPSLLESSDIDGGSSVAVLTYLRRILESVDHPDMINLILHYLLALPDIVPSAASGPTDSVAAARKRKSLNLATMVAAAQDDAAATPLLFNLVDLILACLRSDSQQTINVTLQLVSAILQRHHRYAVFTLLHTEAVRGGLCRRTIGAHEQEVTFLMSLAGSIGGHDDFGDIYDSVLRDTTVRLESHPCSLKLVAHNLSSHNHKLPAILDSLPGAPQDVGPHTLRPDDPLLNVILDRLETFFMNPVETNLSLTDAIFELAVCGFMSVEGWFLRNPQRYSYGDEGGDSDAPPEAPPTPDSPDYDDFQKARSMMTCRRQPKWDPSTLPRLLTTLQLLTDEIAAYRRDIPRFDDLLQQRRAAFRIADSVNPSSLPARSKLPDPPATPTAVAVLASRDDYRSDSAARPSGLEVFAQRFLSDIGTPIRPVPPRGRNDTSRPSSGRSTPAPTPARQIMEAPAGHETPPGGSAGVPGTSSPAHNPDPLAARSREPMAGDRTDEVVASQSIASQPVDQGILSSKVGLPVTAQNRISGGTDALVIQLEPDKGAADTLEGSHADADAGSDPAADEQYGAEAGGHREEEEESADSIEPSAVSSSAPVTEEAETTVPREGHQGEDEEEKEDEEEDGEEEEEKDEEEEAEEEAKEEEEGGGGGGGGGGGEGEGEGGDREDARTPSAEKTVSVSHVLTNVIILQSFLFELASLVQVRAGLFDEVRFV